MTQKQELLNFVNGKWQRSRAGDALDVLNPATGAAIATVGLSPAAEVDAAVRAPGWTPMQSGGKRRWWIVSSRSSA